MSFEVAAADTDAKYDSQDESINRKVMGSVSTHGCHHLDLDVYQS